MAELNIGGEAFHVVVEGDEEAPVVLLPNVLGTTLHVWDAQMPALLKHYRVVRYDSRGHGNSVVSEGPYSIAQLGQDALAILDTLGLEQVDFVGLSLGGFLGQWLLTHAPKRIRKAVLANTGAQIGSPDSWNSRIQTVLQDGMGAVASSIIESWFTKDFRESHPEEVVAIEDMVLKTPPQGYAATCAAIRDGDLREAIRSIQAPVLIIAGRHDATTPPGLGALMASSIPKAKLTTLEASHLSNIEDAESFNEKIIEFLLREEPVAEPEKPAKPKAPRKPREKKVPVEAPALAEIEPPAAAPKKPAMKKAVPKKAAAKKAAVKKRAAAKVAPKKAPAKKGPVKKAAAKKAVPKKVAAKKLAVKKAAPKKATTKKTAIRKTAVKKGAIKKTTKKAMPSRKTGPAKSARKPVKKTVAKKTKQR